MKCDRNGFTMVELLCAIVVLNLLVAGLAELFRGQNQMVNSLEEWCEGHPVFYVVPQKDPMSRYLGVPATLTRNKKPSARRSLDETPYTVELVEIRRDIAKNEAIATFVQKKSKDKDKAKDKKEKGKEGKHEKD